MAKQPPEIVGNWVSYRKDIRVLDCTIRDGGLMNDSQFDDATVRAVYDGCVAAGIDYMEIGYKNSQRLFAPSQYGPWRHCKEDDIRRIVGDNDTPLKLSAIADAEKSDYHTDILPKEQSPLDLIRVAAYIHQIPLALDMIKDAHDKGYETTLNLMAASVVQESEMDEALEMFAQSEATCIYLVDSFGHFHTLGIRELVGRYLRYAKPAGKEVGIHAHNNLQLGFANTIEAAMLGASYLDATFAGLGRGAGNCPMELLLGFLHNPRYRLRPVLDCVGKVIEPLRADLGWGFDLPYMINGFLNRHPSSAMKFLAQPSDEQDIMDYYDRTLSGE
jgi:4-hydroxy 2-oxovalerate aldolase